MTPDSILIACSTNGFSTRFKRWLKFSLQWECDLDHDGQIKVEHLGDGPDNMATFAGLTSRDDGLPESPDPIWVAQTYQNKYWLSCQAEVMPMPVGEVVANYALNCGLGRATKFLQSSLNDFGAKIEADGIIGPKTIQAAWKVHNSAELALGIIAKSQSYYAKIALQGREQWLNGWINRNRALREEFCA
jgi:hypothetical protein